MSYKDLFIADRAAEHDGIALNLPNSGYVKVPSVNVKKAMLHGCEVVVIDGTHYMPFNQMQYKQFCKDASYCDYIDELPERMVDVPQFNDESLLAYAYNFKSKWKSIQMQIDILNAEINLLNKLR